MSTQICLLFYLAYTESKGMPSMYTDHGSLRKATQRLREAPYACLQEHTQADKDQEHIADGPVSAVSFTHQPAAQGRGQLLCR